MMPSVPIPSQKRKKKVHGAQSSAAQSLSEESPESVAQASSALPAIEPIISPRRGRPRKSEPPGPTRDEIVQSALQIAEELGRDGITMRALAACLGVSPKLLYRHIRDKDELIELAADAILSRWEFPGQNLPWQKRLESIMLEGLRMARKYSGIAEYTLRRLETISSPGSNKLSQAITDCFKEAGFSPQEATQMLHAYSILVLGSVVASHSNPGASSSEKAVDEGIRFALKYIIIGIEATLGAGMHNHQGSNVSC